MDDETADITDIRHMAVKVECLHEAAPSVDTTINLKGQHRPRSPRGVLLRQRVPWTIRQGRVVDLEDLISTLEEFRDSLGVVDMTLHPQAESLKPLG